MVRPRSVIQIMGWKWQFVKYLLSSRSCGMTRWSNSSCWENYLELMDSERKEADIDKARSRNIWDGSLRRWDMNCQSSGRRCQGPGGRLAFQESLSGCRAKQPGRGCWLEHPIKEESSIVQMERRGKKTNTGRKMPGRTTLAWVGRGRGRLKECHWSMCRTCYQDDQYSIFYPISSSAVWPHSYPPYEPWPPEAESNAPSLDSQLTSL